MGELAKNLRDMASDPKRMAGHIMHILDLVLPGWAIFLKNNLMQFVADGAAKRVEEMLSQFGLKLNVLESAGQREQAKQTMESEEFTYLFANGVMRTQLEHRDFKRRAMGMMLAEIASGKWDYHFDEKEALLNTLADMGETHLEVLHILNDQGRIDVYTTETITIAGVTKESRAIQSIGDPDRQILQAARALEWLAQHKLAERCNSLMEGGLNHFGVDLDRQKSLNAWRQSITTLGQDLLKMIGNGEQKEDA